MSHKRDKPEAKKPTSAQTAAVQGLQRQKKDALRDLEQAERQEEKNASEQYELADIAGNDPRAAKRLAELEDEGLRISQRTRRFAVELQKLDKRLEEQKEGQGYALKMEAVDRILSERGPVVQRKFERLDVIFEEASKLCDELREIGRANMDDVNLVHPQHSDTRRFNPIWHLIDAVNWRLHPLYPKTALPHPSLRKPLGELWPESLKAAEHTLMQNLKRQTGPDREDNIDEREVKIA